jgi:hypothetical protein
LESPGRAGLKENSLEHVRQTAQDETAKQGGKKREGKKEMSAFNSEASVGMPCTRRIEREHIQRISPNVKRREGKNNPTDSSDETRVGTARTRRIQIEPFDAFSSEITRRKWR